MLEVENARPQQIIAPRALEVDAMKTLGAKNGLGSRIGKKR